MRVMLRVLWALLRPSGRGANTRAARGPGTGLPSAVRRLVFARRHLSGFTFAALALVLLSTALIAIKPANTLWSEELKLDLQLTTAEQAVQGCSPGYWKTDPHIGSWDNKAPDYTLTIKHYNLFNATFGVDDSDSFLDDSTTLLVAINVKNNEYPGPNAMRQLIFHAVAALANASANEAGHLTGYPYTVAQVKQMTKTAMESGNTTKIEATKDLFEAAEDNGDIECPLEKLDEKKSQSQRSFGTQSLTTESTEAQEVPAIPAECAGMVFDLVWVFDEEVEFKGGPGRDLIFGSEFDDVIEGGDGADCIVGRGGNDDLNGEPGNDIVVGSPGSDLLQGDKGKDKLYGGDGADKLWGGDEDDTINGGSASDRCDGGSGTNTMAACEAAPAPGALRGTYSATTGDVTLQWTPVSAADSYNVYVSTDGAAWTLLSTVTKASATHADVEPGAEYSYSVGYFDADGFESNRAAAVTITVPAPTATPTKPATATPTSSPTSKPAHTPTPTATHTPTAAANR